MYDSNPYFYGTGRRKKSVARVRVYAGTGKVTINDRDIDDYFGLETLKLIVRQPLELTGTTEKFDIVCRVNGGGVTGQAGAIRHGLSRALLQYDESLRPALKKAGFLTRDPRMKERSTVSKALVVHRSSARDKNLSCYINPGRFLFRGFVYNCGVLAAQLLRSQTKNSPQDCFLNAATVLKEIKTHIFKASEFFSEAFFYTPESK